jgi:hypothetical protein
MFKRKTQRIIFPGKKLIIVAHKKDLPADILLTGLPGGYIVMEERYLTSSKSTSVTSWSSFGSLPDCSPPAVGPPACCS